MEANILVVEDDEGLARFIELELQHEGYTVTRTDNGRDALEIASSIDFTRYYASEVKWIRSVTSIAAD